ncbi:MAG TPA: LptA/OstA family protein [Stellaceae bacterium]|nr:LptA/OstA family protein [Stellaceae bacterium]
MPSRRGSGDGRQIVWRGTFVLTLGLLLSPTIAAAQSVAPAPAAAPANDQPVQIQADSGIEWDQNAHVYIARGHAVAIRGPSEVYADTLIAHYRQVKSGGNAGDKTEIYRVDADGHVVLHRNDDTVVGDHAVYDVDQAVAVVTGKALKLTTPTDVVTARDSFEWYDNKQIAVARGDAVAVRNNGRSVKADILTAYMHKTAPAKPGSGPVAARGKPAATPASATGIPDPGASKISRIDAQGHVVISNGIDTGRGDFGVYNEDTGIATLIGNVVIERGKDVITGQRGVMDLNRNISRMLPGGAPGHARVQGLFVREQQRPGAPAHPAAARAKRVIGKKAP